MSDDSVNSQIVDTLEEAHRVVLRHSSAAASAIAYQEIVQSLALAVQSGVERLQGVFTVNVATTGAVLARAFEGGENRDELEGRLDASQETVDAAIGDLERLARLAIEALRDFEAEDESDEPEAAAASAGAAKPGTKAPPARRASRAKGAKGKGAKG